MRLSFSNYVSRSLLFLIGLSSLTANAIDFEWGDLEGSFDSTFTVGASWRVENRDKDLVGKFNNAPVVPASGSMPPGVFSTNGDDGNLNFDQGRTFSQIFRGVHELEVNYHNVGFFVRGFYFYDRELMDEDREFKELSPAALRLQGKDADLLDHFVFGSWELFDRVIEIRAGDQVINWGESTFIGHGLSEPNPLDVTKLRRPGAELREAYIPLGAVWLSMDVTDTIAIEGYWQYEWEQFAIDAPGTYFATNDFVGDGGTVVELGFGQVPEGSSVATRIGDRNAKNGDQYGVRLTWFSEAIYDTEFGLYYVRYHNRRPIISAFAHNGVTGVNGFLEYVEDLDLIGFSFNTQTVTGLSLAGEIAYRFDEPIQIDDVELLFATLEPVGGIPAGTSQLGPFAIGEEISGFREFDTLDAKITLTQVFGPSFGASQWTALLEAGLTKIMGMPSRDKLRFEAPGTARSGNAVRAGRGAGFFSAVGPCAPVECEGVENNDFASSFSWGYRILSRLEYNNLFWSVNVVPRIFFSHDVNGTTPVPISNFVEDSMSIGAGVTFIYLNQWSFDVSYNAFFGAETANQLRDRDFISANVKLSI